MAHFVTYTGPENFAQNTVFTDLGAGWLTVGGLGEGASGKTWAVLKRDQNDMIIDERIAVKDVTTTRDSSSWNEDRRLPFEVAAMYRLKSDYVVRIRNWRLLQRGLKYRIYMELCPFGSLGDLVQLHKGERIYEDEINYEGERNYWAPEAFVWSVFEGLALAGLLMERGDDLIVHRDMKLVNVFIGPNHTETFKGYPLAKLGDFGICEIIPMDEKRSSTKYKLSLYHHQSPEEKTDQLAGAGAPGFQNPQRLTPRTNVWAVGDTIWSLLQRTDGDTGLFHWKADKAQPHVDFKDAVKTQHSSELRQLVVDYLQYRPQDRPTFKEMLEKIRKLAPRDLRDAPATDPRFGKHTGLRLRHEKYRLGFSMKEEVTCYGDSTTHEFKMAGYYPDLPKGREDEMDVNVDEGFGGLPGDPGADGRELIDLDTPPLPAASQEGGVALDQSAQLGAEEDEVQFLNERPRQTNGDVGNEKRPGGQAAQPMDLTTPAAAAGSERRRKRSAEGSTSHDPETRRQRRKQE